MKLKFNVFFFLIFSFYSLNIFSEVHSFEKGVLTLGEKKLFVEIATSKAQQEKGLMHRTKMGENEGMLFVFEEEEFRQFWMKNTFIPLSIGFFNSHKELVEIIDMEPVKSIMQKEIPTYQSTKKAKYALEVNQGWFKKNNIKIQQHFILDKNKKD